MNASESLDPRAASAEIDRAAALVNKAVIPDGLTVWAALAGLLPAIPFAFLAWRCARR